jgi:endonuclease/exonuclease/phosphatase (EEP) superfamily protein YafD
MVVLSVGLPLQHHSTRPVWLIGGAAAVALGAWLLKSTRSRVNLPARIATTAIMLLVGLSLVVGTLDSVVIRGQVAPDTSTAARAYRLSNSLTTDMYTLAAADHLITANQSTARADYQSYATAQADLSGISKHWLIVATGPQPTAAFSTIETTLGNAAYWEADAVTKKAQDVVTPDSTVESEIASDRTTYTNQLLAAGTALQQLAQLYGYKLVTNQAQNG